MAKKSETRNYKPASAEIIPTLWVGKNGVSKAIAGELRQQLKLRKKVKVKILKSALVESNRESIAHKLELASGAQLLNLRGTIAVFLSSQRIKKEGKGVTRVRENDICKKDVMMFDSSEKTNLGD